MFIKKKTQFKMSVLFQEGKNILKYSLHTKRFPFSIPPLKQKRTNVPSLGHYCKSPGGLPSAPHSLAPDLLCGVFRRWGKTPDNTPLSKPDAKERQNSDIDLLGEFYYFAGLILILQHLLPFLFS